MTTVRRRIYYPESDGKPLGETEGHVSALAVTGDIDALTLRDFVSRSWETHGWVPRDRATT